MSGFQGKGPGMELLDKSLHATADQACNECLGSGSHTCMSCAGSGARSGDPVFDDIWYVCVVCRGHGWEICACVDRELLARQEGHKE